MLRLGLFIYDHLGGRKLLPATSTIDLANDPLGARSSGAMATALNIPIAGSTMRGLVVLNALDAAERGAVIRTRTRCIGAQRGDEWRLTLEGAGARDAATARVLVNATGPWLARFAETALRQKLAAPVRLDKGSHIVVRRLFEHDRGYIFQTPDRRVVFALPFERDFTLIGTTDQSFAGDPAGVAPGADEIAYLCAAANGYLCATITPADVVWSFAGVRALYDDGSKNAQDTTRDYVLALDEAGAPLLTVYGGKITTYRRLAEDAIDRLAHVVQAGPAWTAGSHLPGGDFPHDGLESLVAGALKSWPFLPERHARRLVRAYGTRVGCVLRSAAQPDDLGAPFGADLTAAEVRYLIGQEWARTADDVLWRRKAYPTPLRGSRRLSSASAFLSILNGRTQTMLVSNRRWQWWREKDQRSRRISSLPSIESAERLLALSARACR